MIFIYFLLGCLSRDMNFIETSLHKHIILRNYGDHDEDDGIGKHDGNNCLRI